MSDNHILFEMSQRLKDQQTEKPDQEKSYWYRHQTPEERIQLRAANRQRRLREQGLTHLIEGKPCTPTQAPFVGEYIKDYEARLADLQKQLQAKTIEVELEQERMERIIGEWNPIFEMFRSELGITLCADGSWRGEYNGQQGSGTNEDLAQAMKEALYWRFSGK